MPQITKPEVVSSEPWEAARQWRWYKRRLVKGGPEVACELWIEGQQCPVTGELMADEVIVSRINGVEYLETTGNPQGWPWTPISEADHRYLTELSAWARAHDPAHPLNHPYQPIRLADADLPF